MADLEDDSQLDLLIQALEADIDDSEIGSEVPLDSNDDTFVTCNSNMNKTTVSTMDGTFCSAVSSLQEDSFQTGDEGDFNDTFEEDSTPEPGDVSPTYLDSNNTVPKGANASEKTPESKKTPSAKIIPLNFDMPVSAERAKTQVTKTLFGSDSEDDELIEKENLNKSGRSIKKAISEREKESEKAKPLPCPSNYESADLAKKSVLTGLTETSKKIEDVAFDKFFHIKIRNPKVSSLAFETFTEGLKKVRASDVCYGMQDKFVTIGVIVDKSEIKKSANGKEYIMWRVHDLKDCQTPPLRVLLFGECCKDYWKLQAGTSIGLVAPELGDPPKDSKDKQVALRVFRKGQVMELGFCPSYGICKGIKNDSGKCSNFVNMDLSEFCTYHVMSQVRSLSSKRGTFNNISGAPVRKRPPPVAPNGLIVTKPSQRFPNANTSLGSDTLRASTAFAPVASSLKVTSKTEEKETLAQLMTSRSHLMGARNLVKLSSAKEDKPISAPKHSSMSEFMKERTEAEARGPRLGTSFGSRREISLTNNTSKLSSDHEAARQRAIALYKQSKEKKAAAASTPGQPKKRPAMGEPENPLKKSKIGSASKEDIDRILGRKFLSDKAADKEENSAVEKYLDTLEKKEKVETFVTSCMSMKNVKVVSCKKCNYTAQKRSELCLRNGHAVTEHTAEKRFFKCKGCSRREISYSLLPKRPCNNCDTNDWERVALRDERKVKLENEQLKVRGDELKYVNR